MNREAYTVRVLIASGIAEMTLNDDKQRFKNLTLTVHCTTYENVIKLDTKLEWNLFSTFSRIVRRKRWISSDCFLIWEFADSIKWVRISPRLTIVEQPGTWHVTAFPLHLWVCKLMKPLSTEPNVNFPLSFLSDDTDLLLFLLLYLLLLCGHLNGNLEVHILWLNFNWRLCGKCKKHFIQKNEITT